MAVSYSASKAATTFIVGYRATGPVGPNYTYVSRRGFLSFDLSGAGLSGTVISAQLILTATAVTGGGQTTRLRSATGASGFGATLDATHDDWASTATHVEGDLSTTTTGTKTWTIDPTHIDIAGVNYFRLASLNEGLPAVFVANVTFASVTNATVASRPILRLVLSSGQVIFVNHLGVM